MTTQCKHIIGMHWVLNPEEGPAWIRNWIREGDSLGDGRDMIFLFPHCPLCGKQNAEVPMDFQDFIITGEKHD